MDELRKGMNTKTFIIVMSLLGMATMYIYLKHAENMKEMEYTTPTNGKW